MQTLVHVSVHAEALEVLKVLVLAQTRPDLSVAQVRSVLVAGGLTTHTFHLSVQEQCFIHKSETLT